MDAIIVNDHEVVVYSRLWIDTVFAYSMTQLDAQPDRFERRRLEKIPFQRYESENMISIE